MKHHTFVCGTSKSKREDAYYIKAPHFWKILYEADITDRRLEPREYRILGQRYGIYLTELVDPDEHIRKRDKDIKLIDLKDGIEKLLKRIDDEKPKRIGFVGKNAATWFYRYLKGGEKRLTRCIHSEHKRTKRNLWKHLAKRVKPDKNYGLLNWQYREIEFFLLTSTLVYHWDRRVWLDFWQHCKYDVSHFMSTRE